MTTVVTGKRRASSPSRAAQPWDLRFGEQRRDTGAWESKKPLEPQVAAFP